MLTLECQSTRKPVLREHIMHLSTLDILVVLAVHVAQLALDPRSVHMGSTGLDKLDTSLCQAVRQAGQDKLDTCLAAQQAAP